MKIVCALGSDNYLIRLITFSFEYLVLNLPHIQHQFPVCHNKVLDILMVGQLKVKLKCLKVNYRAALPGLINIS